MIGVFDSGVGGLTVVAQLKKQLPQVSFIYLGDNARTPYGNRSPEVIKKYCRDDVDFLIAKGAKAIIVACNTASALAGEFLQQSYSIPIFEVIKPAAQAATNISHGRIGIIGTRGTISSDAYGKAIKSLNKQTEIFSQTCPLFVSLVEENWLKKPESKMIAKKYLMPLKIKDIDTLILGCTHYPLMKKIIQAKIGRRVRLIDPAEEVVRELKGFLLKNPNFPLNGGQSEFYSTDPDARFKEIAKNWLRESISLKKAQW